MKEKIKVYDLIVVGGGPAGVAAAVSAKAVLSNVLLVEKMIIGGKVNEIPTFNDHNNTFSQIQRRNLRLTMKRQLWTNKLLVKRLEISSIHKEKDIFVVRKGEQCLYSHSVIIATGSSWKELELEKTNNVHHRSFSYKINSSIYLVKEKTVLVVGGGYSGCQAANFLSKFAKKVYLVHKGRKLTVDYKLENKIITNNKVEVYLNSKPLRTGGKKKLESCIISTDDNLQRELKVSMIFPCVGTVPNSKLAKEVVDYTERGNIKVDSNLQTNTSGLFAAGDVIVKDSSQITTAATEGGLAAQAAIKYLRERI